MKHQTSLSFRSISFIILLILFSINSYSQVGIGTTNPDSDALLELDASISIGGLLLPRVSLTSTSSFAPLSAHVEGMSVYNTNTAGDVRPGQYYNDGSKWIRLGGTDAIDSVTLATDVDIIKGSPGPFPAVYNDVAGMTLSFTARKTSVLVLLTASGFGYTFSMGYVQFRVQNTTSGTTVGGTMTKIQSYDDVTGTVTPWSASFSKLITGLTIGNSYSLKVQGRSDGISGTTDAVIYSASIPDENHLTLSVMQ
jgi:hypothetical protein